MAISGEETVKAFYMEGWVRHDKTAAVEKTIAAVTDAYQLEFQIRSLMKFLLRY